MWWNITFEIKDGKLVGQDGDAGGRVEISGTPPDGVIQINGHTDQWGTTIGAVADGMQVSARMPHIDNPAATPRRLDPRSGSNSRHERPTGPRPPS